MSFSLYTIGHSTRTQDEFLALLKAHGIETLADIRSFPMSRRYPHFNGDPMAQWLWEAAIEYVPMQELGGRRKAHKDSINTAWKNEGFRGYADYMQTPAFQMALEALIQVGQQKRTAIMCAEAVPWRCHRSLVADSLLVRGWQVLDITSESQARPHALTKFARVSGDIITYPGPDDLFPAPPTRSARRL